MSGAWKISQEELIIKLFKKKEDFYNIILYKTISLLKIKKTI